MDTNSTSTTTTPNPTPSAVKTKKEKMFKTCSRCGLPTSNIASRYCARCGSSKFVSAPDGNGFIKTPKKEGKKPMKKTVQIILMILGVIFVIALLFFGGWLLRGCTATPVVTIASETTAPTPAPIAAPDSNYQVGEPANADDINNGVWNQPYSDAIMVDGTTSVYTQSGKDGSTTLSGTLPSEVALVVDSYSLTVNGKSYTGGNLLVIVNDTVIDKDIANYGISYVDGCAQLISTSNLQTLLDDNIALKFARGDWNSEKDQWSYSPWALTNLWIPEGYTYNPLTLTYDTDTYPNRDLATDTNVNTSGNAN